MDDPLYTTWHKVGDDWLITGEFEDEKAQQAFADAHGYTAVTIPSDLMPPLPVVVCLAEPQGIVRPPRPAVVRFIEGSLAKASG